MTSSSEERRRKREKKKRSHKRKKAIARALVLEAWKKLKRKEYEKKGKSSRKRSRSPSISSSSESAGSSNTSPSSSPSKSSSSSSFSSSSSSEKENQRYSSRRARERSRTNSAKYRKCEDGSRDKHYERNSKSKKGKYAKSHSSQSDHRSIEVQTISSNNEFEDETAAKNERQESKGKSRSTVNATDSACQSQHRQESQEMTMDIDAKHDEENATEPADARRKPLGNHNVNVRVVITNESVENKLPIEVVMDEDDSDSNQSAAEKTDWRQSTKKSAEEEANDDRDIKESAEDKINDDPGGKRLAENQDDKKSADNEADDDQDDEKSEGEKPAGEDLLDETTSKDETVSIKESSTTHFAQNSAQTFDAVESQDNSEFPSPIMNDSDKIELANLFSEGVVVEQAKISRIPINDIPSSSVNIDDQQNICESNDYEDSDKLQVKNIYSTAEDNDESLQIKQSNVEKNQCMVSNVIRHCPVARKSYAKNDLIVCKGKYKIHERHFKNDDQKSPRNVELQSCEQQDVSNKDKNEKLKPKVPSDDAIFQKDKSSIPHHCTLAVRKSYVPVHKIYKRYKESRENQECQTTKETPPIQQGSAESSRGNKEEYNNEPLKEPSDSVDESLNEKIRDEANSTSDIDKPSPRIHESVEDSRKYKRLKRDSTNDVFLLPTPHVKKSPTVRNIVTLPHKVITVRTGSMGQQIRRGYVRKFTSEKTSDINMEETKSVEEKFPLTSEIMQDPSAVTMEKNPEIDAKEENPRIPHFAIADTSGLNITYTTTQLEEESTFEKISDESLSQTTEKNHKEDLASPTASKEQPELTRKKDEEVDASAMKNIVEIELETKEELPITVANEKQTSSDIPDREEEYAVQKTEEEMFESSNSDVPNEEIRNDSTSNEVNAVPIAMAIAIAVGVVEDENECITVTSDDHDDKSNTPTRESLQVSRATDEMDAVASPIAFAEEENTLINLEVRHSEEISSINKTDSTGENLISQEKSTKDNISDSPNCPEFKDNVSTLEGKDSDKSSDESIGSSAAVLDFCESPEIETLYSTDEICTDDEASEENENLSIASEKSLEKTLDIEVSQKSNEETTKEISTSQTEIEEIDSQLIKNERSTEISQGNSIVEGNEEDSAAEMASNELIPTLKKGMSFYEIISRFLGRNENVTRYDVESKLQQSETKEFSIGEVIPIANSSTIDETEESDSSLKIDENKSLNKEESEGELSRVEEYIPEKKVSENDLLKNNEKEQMDELDENDSTLKAKDIENNETLEDISSSIAFDNLPSRIENENMTKSDELSPNKNTKDSDSKIDMEISNDIEKSPQSDSEKLREVFSAPTVFSSDAKEINETTISDESAVVPMKISEVKNDTASIEQDEDFLNEKSNSSNENVDVLQNISVDETASESESIIIDAANDAMDISDEDSNSLREKSHRSTELMDFDVRSKNEEYLPIEIPDAPKLRSLENKEDSQNGETLNRRSFEDVATIVPAENITEIDAKSITVEIAENAQSVIPNKIDASSSTIRENLDSSLENDESLTEGSVAQTPAEISEEAATVEIDEISKNIAEIPFAIIPKKSLEFSEKESEPTNNCSTETMSKENGKSEDADTKNAKNNVESTNAESLVAQETIGTANFKHNDDDMRFRENSLDELRDSSFEQSMENEIKMLKDVLNASNEEKPSENKSKTEKLGEKNISECLDVLPALNNVESMMFDSEKVMDKNAEICTSNNEVCPTEESNITSQVLPIETAITMEKSFDEVSTLENIESEEQISPKIVDKTEKFNITSEVPIAMETSIDEDSTIEIEESNTLEVEQRLTKIIDETNCTNVVLPFESPCAKYEIPQDHQIQKSDENRTFEMQRSLANTIEDTSEVVSETPCSTEEIFDGPSTQKNNESQTFEFHEKSTENSEESNATNEISPMEGSFTQDKTSHDDQTPKNCELDASITKVNSPEEMETEHPKPAINEVSNANDTISNETNLTNEAISSPIVIEPTTITDPFAPMEKEILESDSDGKTKSSKEFTELTIIQDTGISKNNGKSDNTELELHEDDMESVDDASMIAQIGETSDFANEEEIKDEYEYPLKISAEKSMENSNELVKQRFEESNETTENISPTIDANITNEWKEIMKQGLSGSSRSALEMKYLTESSNFPDFPNIETLENKDYQYLNKLQHLRAAMTAIGRTLTTIRKQNLSADFTKNLSAAGKILAGLYHDHRIERSNIVSSENTEALKECNESKISDSSSEKEETNTSERIEETQGTKKKCCREAEKYALLKKVSLMIFEKDSTEDIEKPTKDSMKIIGETDFTEENRGESSSAENESQITEITEKSVKKNTDSARRESEIPFCPEEEKISDDDADSDSNRISIEPQEMDYEDSPETMEKSTEKIPESTFHSSEIPVGSEEKERSDEKTVSDASKIIIESQKMDCEVSTENSEKLMEEQLTEMFESPDVSFSIEEKSEEDADLSCENSATKSPDIDNRADSPSPVEENHGKDVGKSPEIFICGEKNEKPKDADFSSKEFVAESQRMDCDDSNKHENHTQSVMDILDEFPEDLNDSASLPSTPTNLVDAEEQSDNEDATPKKKLDIETEVSIIPKKISNVFDDDEQSECMVTFEKTVKPEKRIKLSYSNNFALTSDSDDQNVSKKSKSVVEDPDDCIVTFEKTANVLEVKISPNNLASTSKKNDHEKSTRDLQVSHKTSGQKISKAEKDSELRKMRIVHFSKECEIIEGGTPHKLCSPIVKTSSDESSSPESLDNESLQLQKNSDHRKSLICTPKICKISLSSTSSELNNKEKTFVAPASPESVSPVVPAEPWKEKIPEAIWRKTGSSLYIKGSSAKKNTEQSSEVNFEKLSQRMKSPSAKSEYPARSNLPVLRLRTNEIYDSVTSGAQQSTSGWFSTSMNEPNDSKNISPKSSFIRIISDDEKTAQSSEETSSERFSTPETIRKNEYSKKSSAKSLTSSPDGYYTPETSFSRHSIDKIESKERPRKLSQGSRSTSSEGEYPSTPPTLRISEEYKTPSSQETTPGYFTPISERKVRKPFRERQLEYSPVPLVPSSPSVAVKSYKNQNADHKLAQIRARPPLNPSISRSPKPAIGTKRFANWYIKNRGPGSSMSELYTVRTTPPKPVNERRKLKNRDSSSSSELPHSRIASSQGSSTSNDFLERYPFLRMIYGAMPGRSQELPEPSTNDDVAKGSADK